MSVRNKTLFILVVFSITILATAFVCRASTDANSQLWVGQDLYLAGSELVTFQPDTKKYVLVFQNGFEMTIGANKFFSDTAVVWFGELFGSQSVESNVLHAWLYLRDNVSAQKVKGAKTANVEQITIEKGRETVIRLSISGEIFVTAESRETGDPRGLELYKRAVAAVEAARTELVFETRVAAPELGAKEKPTGTSPLHQLASGDAGASEKKIAKHPKRTMPVEKVFQPAGEPAVQAGVQKERKTLVIESMKSRAIYPVTIAPVGEVQPIIEWGKGADGLDIATVTGRVYLSQQQDEQGGLLELQADNAVIYSSEDRGSTGMQIGTEGLLGGVASVSAIYMSGNVVMTEGQRTIRADEVYYDFEGKKAIAVNAVMRNFDVSRGIPIYVRATKLRQVAENQFTAEDITLTSSEFYLPQISLNASNVIITDTTTIDERSGKLSDSSFDAQMHDVRLKLEETTIFHWPYIRSNLQRPDIPLKGIRTGHDSIRGTFVETRWYLSRLLGLREPEGTKGTLSLDYYGERGPGAGTEIEYEREDYFGRLFGYVMRDTGEDRLGRVSSRRDLEPDDKARGWFSFEHRHFLPYRWQLTTGVNYESDERFVESFYRDIFNIGDERETYIHLKRIEDNWGISFLGKGRLNGFADELEEMPSAEFHLTGQSLFDDRFTLYSDSQGGYFRQRIGNEHATVIDEERYIFGSHRTELDMPVNVHHKRIKIVPFVAGTFGYDDRSGFTRTLVDGSNTGVKGEEEVWIGEAGVRLSSQYWKVYPNVSSRLWDLNQLRHIITPQLTAVAYEESESAVKQHDVLNVAISQRLQTKRGPADNQSTVDWVRLDVDFTWVDEPEGPGVAFADRFIWNKPFVPLRVLSAPSILNGDLGDMSLGRIEMFGPRRNYLGADLLWQVSGTTAVLADLNYDMKSGVVQQLNIGLSQTRWPDLSYYIGSRYLKRLKVLDEQGSNAFVFGVNYAVNERYTAVFSQQYDFDYGSNIRSDFSLIRRYHRMYCGLTFSIDESLDRQAIALSIWPQGVPEMAMDVGNHIGFGGYD